MTFARERLWRALESSRARAAVVVLGVLLAVPSIAVRFYTDDYTFVSALRRGIRPFYDLFRFGPGDLTANRALIAQGDYPWWLAPDFKLHLIRPLTSAVFALDVALFGDAPLGYHLDALVWYAALLVAVSRIVRRVLPGAAGTLALLVFALRSGHVLPYAWPSARHVLIAAVPAMFALLAHVRAVEDGWRPGRALGPLLLLVALSGSEIALGVLPFWVLYDWTSARASAGGRPDWSATLRRSAPAVAMAAIYLASYRLLGGGTVSCQSYHNPLNNPVAFLRVVPTRVPVLLADATLGVPVVFSIDGPVTQIVAAGLFGTVICALLLAAVWRSLPAQERFALTWLLPAALLGLTLGIPGPPWGHTLLVPDLGFSALVGVLLRHGFEPAGARDRSVTTLARVAGTCVLVAGHFMISPAASLLSIHRLIAGSRVLESNATSAEIAPPKDARVFVMASNDSSVFFYPRDVLAMEDPGKVACWSVLSGAHAPHRLTRTGPSSFVLEPTERPTEDGYDALFYGHRTFAVGDVVQQCGATIRVDALDEGRPSRLSVDLGEPLESADLALLQWQDRKLRRLPVPAPGATAEISEHGPRAVSR
jgi:hypothetical protein